MITSHGLQKKMLDVIFNSKKGGKPVTVVTDKGMKEIADFGWCQGCDEFHITLGVFAPEVTHEDLVGNHEHIMVPL